MMLKVHKIYHKFLIISNNKIHRIKLHKLIVNINYEKKSYKLKKKNL